MKTIKLLPLTAVLIALLLPGVALAQSNSTIAGQVTDATGGVLPGVTVEVASPALIEGSRVAVTDGQGQYAVTSLTVGAYTVTFTLPGFSTVVREGIELSSDFTANIDAEMTVGSIEETITVSGESPLVDVQRTQQTEVITREVVDALPTGRNPWGVGMTLPGMTTRSAAGLAVGEVGGIGGAQQNYLARHGSDQGDGHLEIDGMNVSAAFAGGEHNSLYHDDGQVQEYTFSSIGGTSESQTSGVIINMVPREGGNTFSGIGYASYASEGMYNSNFDPDFHPANGLREPSEVQQLWDYNASIGGPLVQDRLWFFFSTRFWGNDKKVPVTFEQPGVDPGEPYVFTNKLKSGLLRFTAQANQSNKLSVSYNRLERLRPFINTSAGPNISRSYTTDATMRSPTATPYIGQVKWTSTLSNRLLLETGYSLNHFGFGTYNQDFISEGAIKKFDDINATQWNAGDGDVLRRTAMHYANSRLSYVTGSHSVKGGVTYSQGYSFSQTTRSGDLWQRYANGVPLSVTVYSTPTLGQQSNVDAQIGLFIQDSWTIDRLTLNGGIRYDYFKGLVPAQTAGAGRFVPERSIGVIDDFPTWHNVSPRFGLAYDLTGDGRTAVKFAIGRYVEQEATGYPGRFNTLGTSSESRSWTDLNGDDIAQDNEIGPTSNVNFGLPSDQRNADPDFSRQTNYSINVNLEHELRPGLSVSGGYYYRKYTNFGIRDNVVTTRADYLSGFAADPRDNGQTVEVFWLDPTLVGQVSRLDINTENWRSYNGFDINLSARFGDGGVVTSGFQAGKLVKNDCEQEDPNGSTHGFRPFFASGGPFCDQTQFDIPFDKTFKLSGAYPLPVPGNIQVSGVFQSVPGDIRTLTGSVTRGNIPQAAFPRGFAIIPFSKPGEEYLDRHNQLDLKFNGTIRSGDVRIQPESCALGFSWTLDCERVLAGGVSRWGNQIKNRRRRRKPEGRPETPPGAAVGDGCQPGASARRCCVCCAERISSPCRGSWGSRRRGPRSGGISFWPRARPA